MDVLHEHKCCDRRKVYKGAWTREEDELLVMYMEARGSRKQPWKDVPRSAGLARCGKSCRFRWLHYLRPNLNRNEFSVDEIDLIYNLRSFVGNKWAKIAKFLPGRSDNSIKNFWNTHARKLPIANRASSSSAAGEQSAVFKKPANGSMNSGVTLAGSSVNGDRKHHHHHHHHHNHNHHHHHPVALNHDRAATSSSVRRTLKIDPEPTPMKIPKSFQSSRTSNQDLILKQDPSSIFNNTSSITDQRNFQDDFLSFMEYDIPLPGSLPSQILNQSSIPTWEINSIATHDDHQSIFNGDNINPSGTQVLQQPHYDHHEFNNLYDYEPSLFGPQCFNHQLMGHSVFGDRSSSDRGNDDLIESGIDLNTNVYQSDYYFGRKMVGQDADWDLNSSLDHFGITSSEEDYNPFVPSNHLHYEYINHRHGNNF